MIRHLSFNAHDTDTAAAVIAEMLDLTAVRAPSPPFVYGAWFLCSADERGTMLDLEPWGITIDPEGPFGIGKTEFMPPLTGTHIAVSTPKSQDEVMEIARRAGWQTELVDQGPFQVINVWVEGTFLLEILTPDLAPAYEATFNAEGVASLDELLRSIEKEMVNA